MHAAQARSACYVAALMAVSGACRSQEVDLAGYVGFEPRIFYEKPAYQQHPERGLSPSAVISPELRYTWNEGSDRITVIPFYRYDADDENRTHWDLREANWQHIADPWTLLVGMGKVFWGVAESRHLVDIINQTDLVEDIDQEQKLGQPMIHLERWSDNGAWGFFLLPGFRERTFPANDARLRGPLPISNNGAVYDSGTNDKRVDLALRWVNSIDSWDIGLSGFYGNGREPRLVVQAGESESLVLVPHYDVISQIGADIQYTREAWLWKLEVIGRSGHGKDFGSMVGGTEYTFFGIRDTNIDIGVLAEYLYDARDEDAPPTSLDDDIFFGTRFSLNDLNDTNILAGMIVDPGNGETITIIEAERRIGERWKIEFDLRLLTHIAEDGRLYGIEKDSYVTLRADWFF